jgi:hypothetical protein
MAAAGAALGAGCMFVPEHWQPACHLAAKLVALFGGH